MDEDPELRGAGRRGRPHAQASAKIGVHRVNDFVVGHVGQVSYSPAGENVEVGEVNVGRLTEQFPFCQQIVPFKECISSSRLAVKLPPSRVFQRNRSQRNWLLKTHPEAFLGFPDLATVLSQESTTEPTGHEACSPVGPIVAVGEIVDLQRGDMSRNTPWPAVAMVSGEAGHMLHLTAIELEKWTWKGFTMPVGTPQPALHGSWCDDGSPILQIQFAKRAKLFDSLHWLVVQKQTSITIFEPEIRAWPVATAPSRPDNASGAAEHIALNPVITLTTRMTGLRSHADFSLDMGTGAEAPQLSVIDEFGSWSIWYLLRTGHGRSRTMKPMLRRKGSFAMTTMTMPRAIPQHLINWVKVLWMTKPAPTNGWRRGSTPSETDGGPSSLQASYLADYAKPRVEIDGLVLCDRQQIRVLDIDSGRLATRLEFARRDGKDVIIDAQSFPGSPGHHLILTTHKIYLMSVSKGSDAEVRGPQVTISCPHYRSAVSQGLKMLVSKQEPVRGGSMCLALLYSVDNARVDAFWFEIPEGEVPARFHHQVLQLQGFRVDGTGRSPGIASLTAVPLQLSDITGRRPSTGMHDNMSYQATHPVQFLQVFALCTDLSLHSSMLAITLDTTQKVERPSKVRQSTRSEARRIRRKILQEAEQAFTVHDDVSRVDHHLVGLSTPSHTNAHQKQETFQLRHFFNKVIGEVNEDLQEKPGERQISFNGTNLSAPILAALQDADSHRGYVPLKPLLYYLGPTLPRDLSLFEDEWQSGLKELKRFPQIQLSTCGSYVNTATVLDVFEKLSIKWSSQVPAESLKISQWMSMEKALQRMAVELFLSERGAYAVPQSVLDLGSNTPMEQRNSQASDISRYEAPPSSQIMSSQVLPTPSATPASTRAASEDASSLQSDPGSQDAGLEDAAVARLRRYLPSIKFTPAPKTGPSHVISLWPEQRGVDPAEYHYQPLLKGKDAASEAAKRRREKHEERERRRAERKLLRGSRIDTEREWESQPLAPTTMTIQSSPLRGHVGSSKSHSQGSGFAMASQNQSQGPSFSQGFGFSQNMSQPVAGEFGSRPRKLKSKPKPKKPKVFR
ncbi:RNA polymerase I-specific transcription initiation factor RRN6-like protein [Coniella lustricola]|uniref:RNA polymerase I-specific transcription initiation factor RRN6-like protein n=1 Tax=Coniella lustricola TaxID=2025994 RepID=A0A2T2ZZV6_9PEZI|nr:RNA polymerase I-specific transcription initiation factor RRN6-like protein [Coniella lustricola]